MTSTDAALRATVTGDGDERSLTLEPAFQGLPDSAHGGTVLGLFDALAGADADRHVTAHYRRRVPVGVPLRLAHDPAGDTFTVGDAIGPLVAGRVLTPWAGAGQRGTPIPASPSARLPRAGQDAAAGEGSGAPLPVSRTCFACGVDNPLGLRVQLAADDARVGGAWRPRPAFAREDGTLAPVALTTLLDETAFWLGALASGESGMTTELAVTLHGAVPFGDTISVVGERAAVRPRREDPRYWDTRALALDARGRVVAEATITFVAVRGAARRLVTGLLSMNAPQTLRRVFPAYVRA